MSDPINKGKPLSGILTAAHLRSCLQVQHFLLCQRQPINGLQNIKTTCLSNRYLQVIQVSRALSDTGPQSCYPIGMHVQNIDGTLGAVALSEVRENGRRPSIAATAYSGTPPPAAAAADAASIKLGHPV